MNTTVTAATVPTADGELYYELRGSGPLLALVGAPMNADAFAPLAELLASEYTVLTMDPRGIKRSVLTDPAQESTPQLRAGDLVRVFGHIDAGPAIVMGSSGGALSALALAQTRPELVRLVIAHEPATDTLFPDRERYFAGTDDVIETYLSGDVIGAWSKFLAQADIEVPPGAVEHMFGGERDEQDVADERRWFAHELRATTRWEPDLVALREVAASIVIGIGEDSAGQECDRASRLLAAELGIEPVLFPGDHTGFADDPARFLPRLREVLAGK